MSLFSGIKAKFTHIESDAAKFSVAFERLFAKLPSVIQTVSNFTSELAPFIIDAVAIADPVAEPAVAAALALVERGLAAIEASAQAAVSGHSLAAQLQNFSATVPTLLNGLEVKNPALKGHIEKIVNLVASETRVLVPAVQNIVTQVKSGVAPAAVSVVA